MFRESFWEFLGKSRHFRQKYSRHLHVVASSDSLTLVKKRTTFFNRRIYFLRPQSKRNPQNIPQYLMHPSISHASLYISCIPLSGNWTKPFRDSFADQKRDAWLVVQVWPGVCVYAEGENYQGIPSCPISAQPTTYEARLFLEPGPNMGGILPVNYDSQMKFIFNNKT